MGHRCKQCNNEIPREGAYWLRRFCKKCAAERKRKVQLAYQRRRYAARRVSGGVVICDYCNKPIKNPATNQLRHPECATIYNREYQRRAAKAKRLRKKQALEAVKRSAVYGARNSTQLPPEKIVTHWSEICRSVGL